MGTLYLISSIIVLILFIIIKKTEKEINLISFACISIVTMFCYNAVISYVLTLWDIPIKLWVLTIINILIASILATIIFRQKQIQKFIFNKLDILFLSLIVIVILVIIYINFGIPFNIKYETSDPSVHYLTSVKFAESETLLANVPKDDVYMNLRERKTVSYVNSGLLMKIFSRNLDPIECYNIFVIFGALTLFLTGATLYSTFTNFAKNNEHRLWAFIVSLICILGYPLNSFLFGFEYMSMALLIICAILDLIYYYDEKKLDIRYFIIAMLLLNFGLFASYYMFVPFVYTALGIYFWKKCYKTTNKMGRPAKLYRLKESEEVYE